jgi:hypothetical protein
MSEESKVLTQQRSQQLEDITTSYEGRHLEMFSYSPQDKVLRLMYPDKVIEYVDIEWSLVLLMMTTGNVDRVLKDHSTLWPNKPVTRWERVDKE